MKKTIKVTSEPYTPNVILWAVVLNAANALGIIGIYFLNN